jgi:hypothetical protein
MKTTHYIVILLSVFWGTLCFAQVSPTVINDFKPASTNQPGKEYPQVNSEGRVRASISAPEAQRVQLDIGGVKYDLTKDEKGVWTGDSNPQDEGFHYYQLWIDGAAVPDPGSLYFYGAGRWGSGVEVPARDQDFYALKDVPHGQIRQNLYFSKVTNAWRRCFVYSPPDYEKNTAPRWDLGGYWNSVHMMDIGVISKSIKAGIEFDRWYDIKLEIMGNSVKGYLDGKLVQEVGDERTAVKSLCASASRDNQSGDIILKVVNAAFETLRTQIELKDAGTLSGSGKAIVLTSKSPLDENTLDELTKVSPITENLKFSGTTLTRSFPGNSFTIIRLPSTEKNNND